MSVDPHCSSIQREHYTYQRLAGASRYETSQEIARFFVEAAGGGTHGNYFYFIGWAAEGKSTEFGSLKGWIESA